MCSFFFYGKCEGHTEWFLIFYLIYTKNKLNKMTPLENLISKFKTKHGKAFGGLFQKLANDLSMINELEMKTDFLNDKYTLISIQQRFYHLWFNVLKIEECIYCKSPRKFHTSNRFSIEKEKTLGKKSKNYFLTCDSKKCKKEYKQSQTEKAIMNLFGVINISQTEEWHTKVKATNIINHKVEWHTQSENFKNKSEITWLQKYGVNHHSRSESTKNKIIKTCIKRYGVNNVLQDAEIYKKGRTKQYKIKKYVFPSGRVDKVQGYEPFALNDLLNNGYNENDIITDEKIMETIIGKIFYIDREGKRHRYYPDIYIKSENKIIEVKSTYTITCNVNINKLKKKAIENLGILFEYAIYNKDSIKNQNIEI